ncbi:epigen [Phyllobates terribilis]|uniref:epigen n=1 Tax=Phyllobates terribilis TaxID=111132 RepID=UPI003CCAC9E7
MALHIVFLILTCAVMTVFSEDPAGTLSPNAKGRNSTAEWNDNVLYEVGCPEDLASFCINGHCIILKSLGEPLCRCNSGFIGERCEQIILSAVKVKEMEATHIAIGIGIGLLISGLIVFIWFYKEKRCKKSAPNHLRCNAEETLQCVNNLD